MTDSSLRVIWPISQQLDTIMNILVDISHPAYVHLYKNLILEMKKRNHTVIVIAQNQPDIIYLLNTYKIEHIILGDKKDSLLLKALYQIIFALKIFMISRKYKIDIAIGGSVAIAHGVILLKAQSILFTDDDAKAVPFFAKLAYPFADYIVNPDCLAFENYGIKHITVPSFKELAYLHPDIFTPDVTVLEDLGICEKDTYFIVRFSGLKAHHDIFAKGITQRKKLIHVLEQYGKVFITTEREIPSEFEKYKVEIPPEKIHSAIYFATMLIGDSQTMAAEAAVLGTPSIRCNSFVGKLAYLEELEHKYGLTFGFRPEDEDKMYEKIRELLKKSCLKKEWKKKRQRLLADKINLTDWMISFIEDTNGMTTK